MDVLADKFDLMMISRIGVKYKTATHLIQIRTADISSGRQIYNEVKFMFIMFWLLIDSICKVMVMTGIDD